MEQTELSGTSKLNIYGTVKKDHWDKYKTKYVYRTKNLKRATSVDSCFKDNLFVSQIDENIVVFRAERQEWFESKISCYADNGKAILDDTTRKPLTVERLAELFPSVDEYNFNKEWEEIINRYDRSESQVYYELNIKNEAVDRNSNVDSEIQELIFYMQFLKASSCQLEVNRYGDIYFEALGDSINIDINDRDIWLRKLVLQRYLEDMEEYNSIKKISNGFIYNNTYYEDEEELIAAFLKSNKGDK